MALIRAVSHDTARAFAIARPLSCRAGSKFPPFGSNPNQCDGFGSPCDDDDDDDDDDNNDDDIRSVLLDVTVERTPLQYDTYLK
jgi:hypothetical protein